MAQVEVATTEGKPPIQRVVLKAWSTDVEGRICLTPDCLSDEELLRAIDDLVSKLVRLKAKGPSR